MINSHTRIIQHYYRDDFNSVRWIPKVEIQTLFEEGLKINEYKWKVKIETTHLW